MTIAYDASVENAAAADPQTYTHTPVGTPGAVWVGIVHSTTNADIVVGVTYGGVTLDRIDTTDNPTGLGRAYLYLLGSGVPSGAQTVSVDRTEATTTVEVVSITATSGRDVEMVVHNTERANAANPAIALPVNGRESWSVGVLFSGIANTANLTELSGMTRRQAHDFGAEVGIISTQTTASTADFTIGWTAASDQIALVAAAFAEVDAAAEPDVTPSFGGSSLPRSPAFIADVIRRAKTLNDLTKTLSVELSRFAQSVKCHERVAVLPYATTVRPAGDIERVSLVAVTNTSPFIIANPSSPREGVEITFDIYNNSGGTMGTITWGSDYELGAAFLNPSNGKHRIIAFYRSATGIWRELYRGVSDVD